MTISDKSLFGINDDYVPKSLPTDVKLIHGDAFQVLAEMDDGEVDVVLSDPPYSEQTHNGARTTKGKSFRDGGKSIKLLTTFDSISPEQFVLFAREAVRVAKRWVITFCDWKYVHLLEEVGLVRFGIWDKPGSAPQMTGDRPAQGWEAIVLLHRPGKKTWNGGGHRAVWRCTPVDAKRHPTEKPLPLIIKLLRLFSEPGETVLDPFAGSGTTGVGCLLTGRKFIGVEKDPIYYQTARKRLAHRR